MNRTPLLLLLLCLLLAQGCKFQILVPAGGQVRSLISSSTCPPQTSCVQEIVDATFNDSYIAEPLPGWVFLRWSTGDDFLCAGSANPVCNVTNVPLAGNPAAEAIIDSTRSFFLSPVFEQLDREITDTMAFPSLGVEIAQPDLFIGLSWFQITDVCRVGNGGVCDDEIINGWRMDGWTWADALTMNAMFNTYGVSPPLSSTNIDTHTEVNSTWAPAFFNAGWRPTLLPTLPPGRATHGWLRDSSPGSGAIGLIGEMSDATDPGVSDLVRTNAGLNKASAPFYVGAWFYRALP